MLGLYVPLATFFLRRSKIAKWTFEWLFPCMGPNVYIHGPATFALLGTKRTPKMICSKSDRFNHFSGVFANVSSHFMFGPGLFNSTLKGAVKKWICFWAFFNWFWWFKGRSQLNWSSILQNKQFQKMCNFFTKKIVIFYTEILTRKVVLWYFHNSTFRVKISV